MKNLSEKVKFKIVVVVLIIATMLTPFVTPMVQASDEELDDSYVEFDVSWSNGTTNNTINGGKAGTILYTLDLSGVSTGFKNLVIYAQQENGDGIPAATILFNSNDYGTSKGNSMEFLPSMNSGLSLSGDASVSVYNTSDLAEYDKKIFITLSGTYTDPIDKTEKTINKTVELNTHIIPMETKAFSVETKATSSNSFTKDNLNTFWGTEWKINSLTQNINLKVEAKNASYLNYVLEVKRDNITSESGFFGSNTNLTIDTSSLEAAGFTVEKNIGITSTVTITKGTKDATYNNEELFDINSTFLIPITYTFSESEKSMINKWYNPGASISSKVTGTAQGYTTNTSQNGTSANNREKYTFSSDSFGKTFSTGNFEYMWQIAIEENKLTDTTVTELKEQVESGTITIKNLVGVNYRDYRVVKGNGEIFLSGTYTPYIEYTDENGSYHSKGVSDLLVVDSVTNSVSGSPIDGVKYYKINSDGSTGDEITDFSSEDIKIGGFKTVFGETSGDSYVRLYYTYRISVENLKSLIGDNIERIEDIRITYDQDFSYDEEYLAAKPSYYAHAFETENITSFLNKYLSGELQLTTDNVNNSVICLGNNEIVTLTNDEINYINSGESVHEYLSNGYNVNSDYSNYLSNIGSVNDETYVTKTINNSQVKIYGLNIDNSSESEDSYFYGGTVFAYPDDYVSDFVKKEYDTNGTVTGESTVSTTIRNPILSLMYPTSSNSTKTNIYAVMFSSNDQVGSTEYNTNMSNGTAFTDYESSTMNENDLIVSLKTLSDYAIYSNGLVSNMHIYDYWDVRQNENEKISYIELVVPDDYDTNANTVGRPVFSQIITLKMYKNTDVIEGSKKIVENVNPKIYVALPSDFQYSGIKVELNESKQNNKIGISDYYVINKDGQQFLVIECEGTYNSSTDGVVTLSITHNRKLLYSDASANQYVYAYMITDNENYAQYTDNEYSLEKNGNVPNNVFYDYELFNIIKTSSVQVSTGMYIEGKPYTPDGEGKKISSKNNPAIYAKNDTIKYYSQIENATNNSVSNINMVARLPKADNKAVTVNTELLEADYSITGDFWNNHAQVGSITSTSAIPEISLTNLQNIKVYVKTAGARSKKVELASQYYTLGYSTDATANLSTTYIAIEEGTDLSSATTVQVKLNDDYKLPAGASIILEYEMTMPDSEGMVGESIAVSCLKYGDETATILEPAVAYVMTGEKGSIELTKTFQGFAEGEIPEGLTTAEGIALTTLQGIEFKFMYYDENGDEQPLVLEGQTDSNGAIATDANGKITLTNVPNGTYQVVELTEFEEYDQINYTTVIVENSEDVKTTVENPIKKGTATINKQWEDTNDQQGSVTFKLTRTNGDFEYTSYLTTDRTTGIATGIFIPYGTYKVEEYNGVYGWYGEESTITVDSEHQNATIDYENKIGTGTLVITKNVPTGDVVTGLKFEVTGNGYVNYTNKQGEIVNTDTFTEITIGNDYSSNENINVEIAENGQSATITLTNMPLGIYTVEEVEMPTIGTGETETERYVAISRTAKLDTREATTTFNLSNQWKTGNMTITKTAAEGVDLTQFQVRVTCEETEYGTSYDKTFTFPEDGKLTIPSLVLGTYTVEEVESDYYNAYYDVEENGQETRTLTAQDYRINYNKTTNVDIYNESTTGYVKILKTLEGKDAEKAVGLKFNVTGYDPTGSWVSEEIELTATEEIEGTKYAVGTSNAIKAGGEYVITEANTPEYYEDPEETSVDIKKTNTLENPAIVNIENKRAKGNLDISTTTIPAGGPLYPIVYRVVEVELEGNSCTEIEGTEQTVKADATGAEVLKSINAGNYKVEQTTVPDGYIKDLAQIVEVPSEGTGYAAFEIEKIEEFENTTLTIKKEILNSEGEVADTEDFTKAKLSEDESFEVKLTNVDTKQEYYTFISVAQNGIIKGLPAGTYEIEENYKQKYTTESYAVKIEEIYDEIEATEGKYLVTIGEESTGNNEVEIRIQNSINTSFGFGGQVYCDNLSRIDAQQQETTVNTRSVIYIVDEQGKAIQGATFKLFDSEGDEVLLGTAGNVFVSNNKKLTIKGLPAGTYTLKCESVPEGYLVPDDKQVIVYEEAVRIVRVEIQRNIPRGTMTVSAVYTDENGKERYAPRSKYMIMNNETEEILTFEKNLDGTYRTSNVATATDTINVKAGSMQVSGIPAGVEYQVAIVDLTERYGVVNETPELVTVANGVAQEVKVPVKERATGFVKVITNGYDESVIAIDSNGEVWAVSGVPYYSAISECYSFDNCSELTKLSEKAGFENLIGVKFVDGANDESSYEINDQYVLTLLDSEGKIWTSGDGYDTTSTTKENTMICINDIEGNPFNGLKISKIESGYQTQDRSRTDGTLPIDSGIWAIDENGKVWHWWESEPHCVSTGTGIENLEIADISMGYQGHVLMLDSTGNVWAMGDNGVGQCGIDNTSTTAPITELTCINTNNNLNGVKIKAVEAGLYVSYFIDEDNKLWVCGDNIHGCLGIGENAENIWNPICLSTLEGNPLYGTEIIDISIDYGTVGAIDSQGRLWTWGYNTDGLLGTGSDENRYQYIPLCVSDIEDNDLYGVKLTSVSMGCYERSSALDEEGNIWVWGAYIPNGMRYNSGVKQPYKITLPQNSYFTLRNKFTKIALGYNTAAAIDKQGRLWAWGNSGSGTYGTGEEYQVLSTQPVCISESYRFNELLKNKIIDIKIYDYQEIIALDDKGQIWYWGDYNYSAPTCLNNIEGNSLYGKTITSIYGNNSNFVVIDSEGKLYRFESSSYDLVYMTTISNNQFKCINTEYIELSDVYFTKVTVGSYCTMAIDSENRLWAWGTINDGIINSSSTPVCLTTTEGTALQGIKIVDCSCGLYNNLNIVLDENGKVWTFGGYLGNGNTNSSVQETICLSDIQDNPLYGKSIIKVIAGYSAVGAVIDSENKMWTWGYGFQSSSYNSNYNGLGYSIYTPVCFTDIYNIYVDSYSNNDSGEVIITDIYGDVYGWGYTNSGILGGETCVGTFGLKGVDVNYTFPTKLYGSTLYTSNYANTQFATVDSNGVITDIDGNTYKTANGIDGIMEYTNSTIEETGVDEVENIKQSYGTMVILDNDGKVWTKGNNDYGQLGDGTYASRTKYVCISVLADSPLNNVVIEKILYCDSNKIVLEDTDGNIWYTGSYDNRVKVPTKIVGDISEMTLYWNYTTNINASFYALDTDGNIWYIKNNELVCMNTENLELNTVDFTIIYKNNGRESYLAIDSEGNLWGWRDNYYGQLGIGTSIDNLTTPTKITTLSNIEEVLYFESESVIAKDESGNYWTWGDHGDGSLGNGTAINRIGRQITPVKITGLYGKDITYVIGTNYFRLALDSTGKIWTWGDNSTSLCGNGTTTNQASPICVNTVNSGTLGSVVFTSAQIINNTVLALDSTGKIWTWGSNSTGLCANGTTTSQTTPICVNTANSATLGSVVFTSVEYITENGASYILATDSTGTKWTWGANSYCQIEFSDITYITTPQVWVNKLESQDFTVDKYLVSDTTTIIKDTNGNIWGWGNNSYGQLGNGTTTKVTAPVNITQEYANAGCTISDILYIDSSRIIVKDTNGKLWGCGFNGTGVLGTANGTPVTSPTKISDDFSVNTAQYTYISSSQIVVLTEDGDLYISGSYECLNDKEETALYGKTVVSANNNTAITNDGKLYTFTTSGIVTDVTGSSYETTGTWDTGFILLKDAKYAY